MEKTKMYIEEPIRISTYDLDYMSIVNNTAYTKYLEDLRMSLLNKYFPLREMMAQHNTPIIAETHIYYKHPISLNSNPVGRARISALGKSKWECEYEIVEGDKVYCTALQVCYYFNLDTNRPTRFPQEFIELYNNME